jgi:hypothetical protein
LPGTKRGGLACLSRRLALEHATPALPQARAGKYWSVCVQPVARDFDFAGSVRHAVKGLAHLGLAARAFASLKLPKAPLLVFCSAEKSHKKIASQYKRHERQQKKGPIRIAVCFWRGLAARKEDAKDTIAPQMVHGSSIGRGLAFTADDIEYSRRYQEAELRVLDDGRIASRSCFDAGRGELRAHTRPGRRTREDQELVKEPS